METFYSGDVKIEIEEDSHTSDGRMRARGAIVLKDGTRWAFSDLASGCGGARDGLIEMAEAALAFGAYYSHGNRGDDVPEWAPSADVANQIEEQAWMDPESVPPYFPSKGETDDDQTYYRGDHYAVFSSIEAQEKWAARWDAARYALEAGELDAKLRAEDAPASAWGAVVSLRSQENAARAKGGLLPRCEPFAWPGGYPIIYVDEEGEVYCANCATDRQDETGRKLDADIYYEGPATTCDVCNEEIESAYGDPDEKEEA